ncbi:hypothetical protein ABFA07_023238 [Porites harrisoni]
MAANDDGLEGTDTTDSKGNSAFLPKDEDSFDFDLYGDLSVDLNQEMTYPELKKLYEESQQKIKELKAESQKLRDENLILKKNISSLYLTAREEIKRKDAQIKTLQDREVRSRRKYVASQQ